jgi:hypothetical protein
MIDDPSAPPRGGVGPILVKSGGLTRGIHISRLCGEPAERKSYGGENLVGRASPRSDRQVSHG